MDKRRRGEVPPPAEPPYYGDLIEAAVQERFDLMVRYKTAPESEEIELVVSPICSIHDHSTRTLDKVLSFIATTERDMLHIHLAQVSSIKRIGA
jgi:hypothetical protein